MICLAVSTHRDYEFHADEAIRPLLEAGAAVTEEVCSAITKNSSLQGTGVYRELYDRYRQWKEQQPG